MHLAERLEPRLGEPRLRERLTKLGTLAERGEDFPRRAGVEDRDPAATRTQTCRSSDSGGNRL